MKNNQDAMDFTQLLRSMHSDGIKSNRPTMKWNETPNMVFLPRNYSMILKLLNL